MLTINIHKFHVVVTDSFLVCEKKQKFNQLISHLHEGKHVLCRHGRLMINTFDSGSSSPGLSAGLGQVLYSWVKK